jgi:hypothetical protein
MPASSQNGAGCPVKSLLTRQTEANSQNKRGPIRRKVRLQAYGKPSKALLELDKKYENLELLARIWPPFDAF